MLAGMTLLAAAAAPAAHEAAKSGLPQLNATTFAPQLFWLVVVFVTLFYVLAKIVLPRIGEVITERGDRIARDIKAATRLKGETDKALADYEKALADARARASGIAKETREKLDLETAKEKSRVEGQISAKITQAEARIGATKTKALASVNEIAISTATAVVGKLIGQDATAEEVKKALTPTVGA